MNVIRNGRAILLALCIMGWKGLVAAPALLDGADRVLQEGAAGLAFSPVRALGSGQDSILTVWVGLGIHLGIRNDDLSIARYNRFAGKRLDVGDRQRLLDLLGNSMALHGRARMVSLALRWQPGEDWWAVGGSHELSLAARAGADTRVLRTLFFGNDPAESIGIRDANVRALLLNRWALHLGMRDPRGGLPGWTAGASLGLQQGAMAQSTLFQAGLEPPVGQLAGHFEHRMELAHRGRGWFLDLAAGWDGQWLQRPLHMDLVLRGLVNRMRWSGVHEEGLLMHLDSTPISSQFQFKDFEDALIDSSWTRHRPGFWQSLPATLELGLDWQLDTDWHLATLGSFTPAGGPDPGHRRLSVLGRYTPPRLRGVSTGVELSSGSGRGPGLGLDARWHSTALPRLGGSRAVFGLGITEYAGVFSFSRGLAIGWNAGLEF